MCPAASLARAASCDDQLEKFRAYRRSHDKRLHHDLVCHYLPLVRKIARHYPPTHGASLDDLIQIGAIGLIHAVSTFDPGRGLKFETYAHHHIAGAIRHYLRGGLGPIRLPRWVRRLYGDLTTTIGRLQQELGRPPTLEETAARMNVTENGILEILRAHNHGRVLSVGDLDGVLQIRQDLIVHQRYVSLQLPIEDRIVLLQALERLAELQRKVVFYIFYQDLTQTEVAVRLGVSQKHVSRLLAHALQRLAKTLRAAEMGPSPITS